MYRTGSIGGSVVSVLAACLLIGCQSNKESRPETTPQASTASAAVKASPNSAAASPSAATEPIPARAAVRIKAGTTDSYKDSDGNVWLPDQGFADGETIARVGDLSIANTKDPALYRTEHYAMTAFSYKLPNGKYAVKLHFAETFEEINGPGQRVFSFKVQDQEFKDFDIFVRAGGAQKAYIQTVNVEVTGGKLDIAFTANIQNPAINGIEIIPHS